MGENETRFANKRHEISFIRRMPFRSFGMFRTLQRFNPQCFKFCKAFLICFIEEYNCRGYMQVGHSLQIKTLGADVKNKF